MRLFLASHDFGNYADVLQNLVGTNRRTLIITNARDYRSEQYIQSVKQRKVQLFQAHGFDVEWLDLRQYFNQPQQLREYIKQFNPGLVYSIGGNVFLLATALSLSGMDEILHEALAADRFVYGGGSAGSMVAGKDLSCYERGALGGLEENLPASAEKFYHHPGITNGLGLIDDYIVPHADNSAVTAITHLYQASIERQHHQSITLNDTDVYIVNGDSRQMLSPRLS